jgi:hypothetical protein
MSLSFECYLIALNEIREFYGSRDSGKVEQIVAHIGGHPAFQFFTMEGGGDFAPAIRALAEGNVEGQNPEHVLIGLRAYCATFGEEQDNEMLVGVSSDLIEELGSGANSLFFRGSPIKFNSTSGNYSFGSLGMGYLSNVEIPAAAEDLNRIFEEFPDGGDGDVLETIQMVLGWYEAAGEGELDLVGFVV